MHEEKLRDVLLKTVSIINKCPLKGYRLGAFLFRALKRERERK